MTNQRVGDWMTRDPVTISRDLGVGVAYQMMSLHRCRRLPVVDDDRLVGIVTMSDVREARPPTDLELSVTALHYHLALTEVGKIMTPSPRTVEPDATILSAAQIMLEDKIGGLPVVDDGRVVGIITETDVLTFLVRELDPGN